MDFKNKALENKILEIRVGSHLFGTVTPDSDLDLYGVFMPFEEIIFGSHRCDEVKFDVIAKDDTGRNTKDAVDETIVEYRKFIKLSLENNPNILNAMFTNSENIMFKDERGFADRLLGMAEMFPHKGCFNRFIGYANAQKHKMRIKPQNHTALMRGLHLLKKSEDNKVLAELVGTVFTDSGKGKHVKCGDLYFERGIYVSKAKKMIRYRLDNASHRATMYTEYGYDLKFSSNLIQLLKEGIELLNTGRIEFPLAYRQDILDIKAGNYTLEEIIEWSDELENESRSALDSSKLPEKPRTKEIEAIAISEVKKYLK